MAIIDFYDFGIIVRFEGCLLDGWQAFGLYCGCNSANRLHSIIITGTCDGHRKYNSLIYNFCSSSCLICMIIYNL